jgi:DMSO/TMAO reductase YedYZ molybdopterin-dependent catalytic subunit
MKRWLPLLLAGFVSSVVVSALSLGARLWAGIPSPLEAVYKELTHFLGVPAVFQLVHQLFGFGQAGKVVAFIGSAALWVGGVALLGLLAPMAAAALVGLVGVLLVGPLWGVVWGLVYFGVRLALEPVRVNPQRRTVLNTLGVGAAGLFGVGVAGALQPLFASRPAASGGSAASSGRALPEGITSQEDLYYISINNEALDPKIKEANWKLEVGGLVREPSSFTLTQLKEGFTPNTLEFTMSCISNPIGGSLIGNCLWTGLKVKDLLERVGVQPGAKWIQWEAADGFYETYPLNQALEDDVILAYHINDEPLNDKHGFPLRVILPGHFGMKQPRWLTKITLSAEEKPGYWADRGWSRTAYVQPMSRIDSPSDLETLKAGQPLTLRGIAYAGRLPVTAVQVTPDNGKTWLEATLKPPRSPHAWTQWTLEWTPPEGAFTLEVRCVAGTGEKRVVQSGEARDSLPEAASGYDRVSVTAS